MLNLVSRIAKRGWLRRRRKRGKYHYAATVGHEVAAQLAGEFVQDFFEGSASELVMSLLGSDRLSVKEIERLRQLLKSRLPRSDKGKDTPP